MDDVPNSLIYHPVVLMPNHISKGLNRLPFDCWTNFFRICTKSFCCFADNKKHSFNSSLGFPILLIDRKVRSGNEELYFMKYARDIRSTAQKALIASASARARIRGLSAYCSMKSTSRPSKPSIVIFILARSSRERTFSSSSSAIRSTSESGR